jgi:hypothetical protein
MHDAFAVGIPVLAVLFGAWLNHQGLSDLRADVKADLAALRTESNSNFLRLESRIDRVSDDLYKAMNDLIGL